MQHFAVLPSLAVLLASTLVAATHVSFVDSEYPTPNLVAGTWSLATANITQNGTTAPAFGDHPVGILIFAPTLYFSELITVDPSTLPVFTSNSKTNGTAAENAAVVAGTLGQIGNYTVASDGTFKSEVIIASTFPNWIGLYRNTTALNETVDGTGRLMHEMLHDPGTSTRVEILWERVGGHGGRNEWR
ncbi:hypothetical protein M409DRAFT_21364 [Zasmidium cellare ATCC 36951]|uniref:Lipocalin-like domain-containing protein n=1 Tax=Zasmidium cellare ATCC 36951 TaxID=1080233 RepID=A0A6A6CR23_ZASCE|nr:uncharacterized protein M409DRAFT_21364 [Zasmidium cellare ATCC 36951]KAF2168618.1 hypothetical protein M409DRAFT_21364 [Zasmidium cellare ATCC 36951]